MNFSGGAGWGPLDLVHLREEFEGLFGREVDLVAMEALRDPYPRRTILDDV